MTVGTTTVGQGTWSTDFAEPRRPSFALSGVAMAFLLVGVVTLACALAGVGDDNGDALSLGAGGAVMIAIGESLRRRYFRPKRTPPARILRGLGIIWVAVATAGAAIYLITGAIDRVDDALLEATAGFTTTNLTTLDPTELSRSLVLWRSATQWCGGYMAILLGVVALPEALKGTALLASTGEGGHDLVSDAIKGRRRILALYSGLTTATTVGFLLAGMGWVDAVGHSLATVSTGGFSTRADSFTSFGAGPQTVATGSMLLAGASIFVLWWMVRGKLTPLRRSRELRIYLVIIAFATALIMVDVDGLSFGDALFTSASITSTTGFAVGDWALWSDDAEGVLLIVAATGAMLGSAGGGFRILRAQLLVMYALSELRRQLDPRAVIVVKHRGVALDDRTLQRLAGFQISHMMVCGVAALVMASLGTSLLGAIWGATSAVSNLGPAVGEIGSFGSVAELPAPARAVLLPAMLAGRLSVMPALVIVVWGLRGERQVGLQARRLGTAAARRVRRGLHRG